MSENQFSPVTEESPILDCFGIMYDPYITPCRDKCDLKDLCRDKVRQNVSSMGEERMKEEERRIMEKTLTSGDDMVPLKSKMEVQYSEPVMRIVELLTNMGLQIHYKAGYIAAKLEKRNIFSITRAQSPDYNQVIKFVFTKEREDFPQEVLPFVSEKKSGEFWTCSAPDLETLKDTLEKYIQNLKK